MNLSESITSTRISVQVFTPRHPSHMFSVGKHLASFNPCLLKARPTLSRWETVLYTWPKARTQNMLPLPPQRQSRFPTVSQQRMLPRRSSKHLRHGHSSATHTKLKRVTGFLSMRQQEVLVNG